ncbi:MAG: hypothetical protein PHW31_04425 [Candidatus Pacebacteria bacterium]|nr:hypothetical protein [Candidatus Paceibacterota bacterium]
MGKETITLPKTEFNQLKQQALAYRKFATKFFDFIIRDSAENVVNDFRATNLYAEGFLRDLKTGLSDSTYFKNYGNQTTKAKVRKISRKTSSQ